MGTGSLIPFFAVVCKLQSVNDTGVDRDFLGFLVLKSPENPEICFS